MIFLVTFVVKLLFSFSKGSAISAAIADHIFFAKLFSGAGELFLEPENIKCSLVRYRSHGSYTENVTEIEFEAHSRVKEEIIT